MMCENLKLVFKWFQFVVVFFLMTFTVMYGVISFYNFNTYCVVHTQVSFMSDEFGIYEGSLVQVEYALGLPRYRLGLYADYSGLDVDIVSGSCGWKWFK